VHGSAEHCRSQIGTDITAPCFKLIGAAVAWGRDPLKRRNRTAIFLLHFQAGFEGRARLITERRPVEHTQKTDLAQG
jgi:hypothetical protein